MKRVHPCAPLALWLFAFGAGCASNNTSYNEQANSRFSRDHDDHPPRLVYSEQPVFPPGPKTSGKTDWRLEIDVGFVVDETGVVRGPAIVRSSDGFHDSLALECIQKWRFLPALENGKPVATRVVAPFRFELDPRRRAIPITTPSR